MSTTVGCSLSVDFDGELVPRNLNVTREKAINVVGPARERHFSLQSDLFYMTLFLRVTFLMSIRRTLF